MAAPAPEVTPARAVTFPAVARIILGAIVGLVTYFVAGDYIDIGEAERTLISSVVVLLGSVGIVPPKPEDINMSQTVAILLTIAALVLNYVLNTVVEMDELLRGILLAVLAFATSVGITPPQTKFGR